MTRILTIFCLLTLPVLAAWGQSVKLVWTPSLSSDVTNYNLYWGTNGSGVYQAVIPVGTNLAATLSNMLPAHYWFAATCQNTNGAESPFSNEATWAIPSAPTNLYMVILNVGLAPNAITNPAAFFNVEIKPP
jgi:hypothetical protein